MAEDLDKTTLSGYKISGEYQYMSLRTHARVIRAGEGVHQNVLGDEEVVKLTGRDTGGALLMIEQNSMPGVGIPPHVHRNEDEVFHVLEGELEVMVKENCYTLGPGDTAFCPRGVPHSWKVSGNQRAKVLLLNYPAGLENMLEELSGLDEAAPFDAIAEISARYGITFLDG